MFLRFNKALVLNLSFRRSKKKTFSCFDMKTSIATDNIGVPDGDQLDVYKLCWM